MTGTAVSLLLKPQCMAQCMALVVLLVLNSSGWWFNVLLLGVEEEVKFCSVTFTN